MSDTFAILEVPHFAYDEISKALKKAGYHVERDGEINMEGIHLKRKDVPIKAGIPGPGQRLVMFPSSKAMLDDLPVYKLNADRGWPISAQETVMDGRVVSESGQEVVVIGGVPQGDCALCREPIASLLRCTRGACPNRHYVMP